MLDQAPVINSESIAFRHVVRRRRHDRQASPSFVCGSLGDLVTWTIHVAHVAPTSSAAKAQTRRLNHENWWRNAAVRGNCLLQRHEKPVLKPALPSPHRAEKEEEQKTKQLCQNRPINRPRPVRRDDPSSERRERVRRLVRSISPGELQQQIAVARRQVVAQERVR